MYSKGKDFRVILISISLLILFGLISIPDLEAATITRWQQWANEINSWTMVPNVALTSSYTEGEVVPYRLYITDMEPGNHTVTFQYQYVTMMGDHGIDYLMTYNDTENPPIGSGISNFPWSGPSTFAIPPDSYVSGAGVTQQPGAFTIYNGTITSASAYSYVTLLSVRYTRVTLTFSSATDEVLIVWGGHLAHEDDWGDNNGASQIILGIRMGIYRLDSSSILVNLLTTADEAEEGIEIAATKTANAELHRTYAWTIEKTVTPDAWELLDNGQTGTSVYTISVTKSIGSDVIAISGQICVENLHEELATEGLKIEDRLLYKTASMTDWAFIPDVVVTIVPADQIPASSSVCYDYSFTIAAIEGAEYRNSAIVTVTNYDGHIGEEYGREAIQDIGEVTVPTTEVFDEIHVEDSNDEIFHFEDTGSTSYERIFSCEDDGLNENTAMIYETQQTANATVTVVCIPCEPAYADFIAEPTTGVSPLEVYFTDLSTNAVRWLWDFGDGTTSEEQHPVHVFHNPPRKYYTVKLTVWDPCGLYDDTITKENFIQVIHPTTVGFSAYPIVGTPGVEVQFFNLSGGVTTHWVWTYGDGAIDEFQHGVMSMINPTHLYTEEGSYSVCLEGSGQGGYEKICVNDLIYVDEDYAAIELVEGGQTLDGEDWHDAIDHNVIPPDASVVAINGDAWAIFKFGAGETRMIDKIRILSNDAFESRFKNHLAKDFQLWVSEDGVNFTPGFAGTLSFLSTWEEFTFAPVKATYLKLVLLNARGAESPYASICEFQVFGKVASGNATEMAAFATAEETEVAPRPTSYDLSPNYPNPFNPETSINYQLPEDAEVRLDIYNVRGELITTLVNSRMNAGYHQVVWNAMDHFGNNVSGGLYFYSLEVVSANAEKYVFTRKMILLK